MSAFARITASLFAVLPLLRTAAAAIDASQFAGADIIKRDVAVIGGGASGAHAAARLRDLGKSVVVVEKLDQLGGHTDTYFDPATGKAYEYGVQSFIDHGNATQFFARFNVTIGPPERRANQARYVDFSTGRELTGAYIPPPANEVTVALQKYLQICEQYEHMIVPGYWNFPEGSQIPSDLLLPISEFMTKHGIVAALPRIFAVSGGGIASREDFAKALTLYVMRDFGAPIARSFLGGVPLFAPAPSNMELYKKIASFLGGDVLYESTVVDSERRDDGVKLVVKGKNGRRKLIVAKRLLLSMQPTRDNLAPFDLNHRERDLFWKAKYARSYTSVATHSKFPDNTSLFNLPEAAVPSNYFAFIQPPFSSRMEHYGTPTKFYRVFMNSNDPGLNVGDAQALARKAFGKMVETGVIPEPGDEKLKFLAISDHGAVGYGVSAEDLRNNWVRDVYALQGKRSTWYTGGSLATDFTTILWDFNETLLPKLLQGL